MNCGCCGQQAMTYSGKTVHGEAMYRCSPCKPTAGECAGHRIGKIGAHYHIFTAATNPARAVVPKPLVMTKKKR